MFFCCMLLGMKATTPKAKRKMRNYITQKAIHREELENHTITKAELMQNAGYSLSTASKNNLENTKLYAEITSETLNKTGFVLHEFLESIERDIANNLHLQLPLQTKIKLLSIITQVHKGLAPSYKQKQTIKDVDGSLKTVWTQLN